MSGRRVLGLAVLFLAVSFPIVASAHRYHSDERFYTDAAMRMVHSGDWLTPYTAEGEPRFNKPVLAYWLLAGSFEAFGHNLLAARVPFLIAGAFLIWITWRLALLLFGREDAALAAAAILASNVSLTGLSHRSTPDVVVALFLNLSLLGFAGLLFGEGSERRSGFLAFLGAGLAFMAKGLLGLLVTVYAILFAWLRKPGGRGPLRLLRPGAILLGAVVGLAWFAAVYAAHGGAALDGFMGDQVGGRAETSVLRILRTAARHLWAPLQLFLPWTLALVPLFLFAREPMRRVWREKRNECLFALLWFLILAAIFSLGNSPRLRYLFPAFPLLACLLGRLIMAGFESERFARVMHRSIAGLVVVLGFVTGGALILGGVRIDFAMVVGGVFLVLAGGWCWKEARRGVPEWRIAGAAGLVLVAFFAVEACVRPTFMATPVPAMEKMIRETSAGRADVAAVGVPGKYIGQLRLRLEGKVPVVDLDDDATAEQAQRYDRVLLSGETKDLMDPEQYDTKECGHSWKKWRGGDLIEILVEGNRDAVFDRLRDPWYLAVRRPGR